MIDKSIVEKVTNSFAVNAAATAVGVFGATITPLAAFIPFLVKSLGSSRHAKRLERMILELEAILEQQSEQIKNLTDDQYKVVNEAISAAFYTINEDKLEFLKRAILNSINNSDLVASASDLLSRIIRDISADEARFVVHSASYRSIAVMDIPEPIEGVLFLKRGSVEETILSGLINLGLVYLQTSRAGMIDYEWSPLVPKLIALLKEV
jgi:hypothetical protein